MPRRRKPNQPVELEAAATFEAWDEMDEASKRRVRNRLSQRHFRERKSLYIKSLEIASKESSQSESDRNKEMAKEIVDLRAAVLKMRAQILKLACSLNSVGAEAGKILHSRGSTDSQSSGADYGHCPSAMRDSTGDSSSPAEFDYGDVSEEPVGFDELHPALTHEIPPKDCSEINNPQASDRVLSGERLEGHSSQYQNFSAAEVSEAQLHVVAPSCGATDTDTLYPEPAGRHPFGTTTPLSTGEELGGIFTLGGHSEGASGRFGGQDMPSNFAMQGYQNVDQHILLQQTQPLRNNSSIPRTPAHTNLSLPTGLLSAFCSSSTPNHLSSTFTRHMETLEHQVRHGIDASPDKVNRDRLVRSCSAIMTLFIQNAWPSSYSVWFKSQVPQIIGPILLWRISPSYDTYNLLGKDYKPTELQLSVPHSAVIDWIPYAEMRDRVIMHYNNSVVLDRLLCDMLNSYVIEVPDLSQIIAHAPRGKAYFGIWNIFRAIDLAFQNDTHSRNTGSPPPFADFTDQSVDVVAKDVEDPFSVYDEFALNDRLGSPGQAGQEGKDQPSNHSTIRTNKQFNLVEIFTTPASVLKLSHDVRLYASRSWRIDHTLFDKYPELKFDGYEDIVAKGRSCRIPTAPPDGPHEMTAGTIQRYQEALMEFS